MRIYFALLILGNSGLIQLDAQTTTNSNLSVGQPMQYMIPKPKVINPSRISLAELQELDKARQEAMKADPDLAKESVQLAQKMRDFQHKVDQIILQGNPSLAPVVATIENAPRAPLLPQPGMYRPQSPTPAPASPPVPSH